MRFKVSVVSHPLPKHREYGFEIEIICRIFGTRSECLLPINEIEYESVSLLRVLLEDVAAVDFPSEFWDFEEQC